MALPPCCVGASYPIAAPLARRRFRLDTVLQFIGFATVSDFLPLTQFDFHHRLADTNGPALVLFTQPGCGACRHLRTVLAGCEWARDLRLFEVDAGRDLALTREFEVFHLPALHLFVDGRYHAPIHAEATPTRLHAALVQALASPPMEAP